MKQKVNPKNHVTRETRKPDGQKTQFVTRETEKQKDYFPGNNERETGVFVELNQGGKTSVLLL